MNMEVCLTTGLNLSATPPPPPTTSASVFQLPVEVSSPPPPPPPPATSASVFQLPVEVSSPNVHLGHWNNDWCHRSQNPMMQLDYLYKLLINQNISSASPPKHHSKGVVYWYVPGLVVRPYSVAIAWPTVYKYFRLRKHLYFTYIDFNV